LGSNKIGSFHDKRGIGIAVIEVAEGLLQVLEVLLESSAISLLLFFAQHLKVILSPFVSEEVASKSLIHLDKGVRTWSISLSSRARSCSLDR
jgi:hypothetical protein